MALCGYDRNKGEEERKGQREKGERKGRNEEEGEREKGKVGEKGERRRRKEKGGRGGIEKEDGEGCTCVYTLVKKFVLHTRNNTDVYLPQY